MRSHSYIRKGAVGLMYKPYKRVSEACGWYKFGLSIGPSDDPLVQSMKSVQLPKECWILQNYQDIVARKGMDPKLFLDKLPRLFCDIFKGKSGVNTKDVEEFFMRNNGPKTENASASRAFTKMYASYEFCPHIFTRGHD